MNKGAVEFFFQQRVVAKVVGRREGGAVGGRLRHGREPDRKNRCWDWSWIPLWMPRPGTIRDRSKATDWQPATSTATQGVAYARNLLGERSLFILFLGHYPWDPSRALLDLRQRSEFLPTLRHVFWYAAVKMARIFGNCYRFQFFLFRRSFCNKWKWRWSM